MASGHRLDFRHIQVSKRSIDVRLSLLCCCHKKGKEALMPQKGLRANGTRKLPFFFVLHSVFNIAFCACDAHILWKHSHCSKIHFLGICHSGRIWTRSMLRRSTQGGWLHEDGRTIASLSKNKLLLIDLWPLLRLRLPGGSLSCPGCRGDARWKMPCGQKEGCMRDDLCALNCPQPAFYSFISPVWNT